MTSASEGPQAAAPADAHPAADADAYFGEPTRRMGGWWGAGFAFAWLGLWLAQLTPIQLLLPEQVASLFDQGDGSLAATLRSSVVAFGVVTGVAALVSVVVYPLAGALSDRTASRFGRRRPWILLGALVFAIPLALLPSATTVVAITALWAVAFAGFCILSSALTSLISDQVPVRQRGLASGLIGAPQALGVILGVILASYVFVGLIAGYTAMAVLLVVLVAPFLLLVKDPPLPAALRPDLTWREFVAGFWISPRRHPDFGWTLLGRILINVGNALGTALLLYWLTYGLQRESALDDLIVLTVVYALTSVIASLVCGRISDAVGNRKAFVLVAAVLMAASGVLLAVAPSYAMTIVGAVLQGVGYGAFLAVDQALATQVLPSALSRGKDLGIMNIAQVVPQMIGPIVGAGLIIGLGGFPALFIGAAVFSLFGALAVIPIRSVR